MKPLNYYKTVSLSLKNYSKAFQFIKEHQLTKYYIYISFFALLLSFLIISGGLYLSHQTIQAVEQFSMVISFKEWVASSFPSIADSLVYWSLFFLIEVPILISGFLVFPVILNTITFPILDSLTEKVNTILFEPDATSSMNLKRMMNMFFEITIPNAFKSIIYSLILLPFSFIPVIGPLVVVISISINAYYLGFDVLDNYFENWNIKVDQSKRFIRSHKKVSICTGLGGSLIAMIPIIGGVLSPALSIVAGGLILKELEVYETFKNDI
ncbi:EI24 domain-containing protein [Flammeovirga agarivorans]|uniref:EI24 domain-containing protein n=1 Tax=Flammeovirga agarivorans TaxID=2726742 RepID=A0A7X8XVC0_9BACT|nr:EI24 domain-containing protein [Flammeovirga agarivorans]NLR91217.1 EI24 domain-containing protein [Flammeovirga agarivorans]